MKRKSARSRLKIEQLEARINLSAVDIGFGTGNFDFNVAGNIETVTFAEVVEMFSHKAVAPLTSDFFF